MFAIRASYAFDGERFLAGGATVFVDDDRIVGVEAAGAVVPDGCELVEYTDATILPGLIDTHVHLVADSHVGALDRVAGYSDDELDAVMDDSLRRQLAAGVTTVRDLGDRSWCAVDRRDRQSRTSVEPTIVASGPPVTSVGGHCHFLGGEVNGGGDMAAAVDERVARGVDVIKVMASGGFNTPGTDVAQPQFSDEDLIGLVERAHAAGMRVVAHAHALPAVEQVARVGVDGIEHFSCLTMEGPVYQTDLVQQLVDSATPVSLTMGFEPRYVTAPPPHILAFLAKHGWTVQMMLEVRTRFQEQVCRSGLRLLCGTDAGIDRAKPHGILPVAIADHINRGLSLPLALAGATGFAAEACGLGGTKGRLRPGYDADLLVVSGDLTNDVTCLQQVKAVVLRGAEIPRPLNDATAPGEQDLPLA